MKLKKLLAAVTAAALAVTTMAVTSFALDADGKATAEDWTSSTSTDSITYTLTSGAGPADWAYGSSYAVDQAQKTVDISSLVQEGEGKTFRCINVETDGAYCQTATNGKIIDKSLLTSVTIGTYWINPDTTQTVTFTVVYGTPITAIPRTITQTNTGNVYKAVVTDAAAPASEDNIWDDKAEYIAVDLTDILPEGFDIADVRKIKAVVTSTYEWGNGETGINIGGDFVKSSGRWSSSDSTTDCVISTPSGLDGDTILQVQLQWVQGGETVTATVTVEDKDGNVYPSTGGSTPVDPEQPGTETPAGTKLTLAENSWDGGSNWQGMNSLTIPGVTMWTTTAPELTALMDGLDVSFKINGALSGGAAFDVSKLNVQVVCQSSDGLWNTIDCTVAGSNATAAINDIKTIFAGKTGTVNIAICIYTDAENSENPVDVYLDNISVVVDEGNGGTTTPEDPTPSTPTPSAPTTSTPTVSNNPAPVSQTTIVDTILATPDGGNGSVNLGSSTKVDKLAIEAIATKGDVTIKLNVAGGAYWEINGQNVTDAKNVDLGVRVNSKQIPESKVEAFAGEKTSIQLSLSHNGDLGFTGTLNVPVGNANNGKFANLYYYHNGKFDFVGSSPIKGGRTQFAFSHASNYLIVIDDYAYGEDVSSAAGMTETTTAETNNVPYVAVLVVLSAFGASAIVLKKRLSK